MVCMLKSQNWIVQNNWEKEKRFTIDLGIGKYIFKASVSYILRIGTIFPPKGFLLFRKFRIRNNRHPNRFRIVESYRNQTLVYGLGHRILVVVHLLKVWKGLLKFENNITRRFGTDWHFMVEIRARKKIRRINWFIMAWQNLTGNSSVPICLIIGFTLPC